jgi:hypothetical protein
MSGGLQKCFDYLGASPFVGLCEVTCDGQCGQVEFQPQAGQSRMGENPGFAPEFCFSPSTFNVAYWHGTAVPACLQTFPLLEVNPPCLQWCRIFLV